MKKRLLAVLLVLVLVLGVCASCEPKKSDADVTLVYWSMWSDSEPQAIVIKEAAEAFEEATGVRIDIQFLGRTGIRTTLEPALTAGETIDLFDEDIDRVIGEWGRFLLPLDSYVNKVYDDTNGQPYRDVVNDALMSIVEGLGASNGGAYGIPYQPFICNMFYSKEAFAEAGVTGIPKTWDEFLDACAKLKASGVTPFTVDHEYMSVLFSHTLVRIVGEEKVLAMVTKTGEDAEGNAIYNIDMSDPGVLKAAEIWEDMAKKGYISQRAASNVYPVGQNEEFGMGTAAMYFTGTWLPNELKNIADFTWGAFAFPVIDAENGAGLNANNFGAQCYGINKDTKYPEEAFAFVRWMTVGEYDQKLATDTFGIPMANDADWPVQLTDSKAVLDASSVRLPWAVGLEIQDINPVIIDCLSKLVLGEITAQEFATTLAAL